MPDIAISIKTADFIIKVCSHYRNYLCRRYGGKSLIVPDTQDKNKKVVRVALADHDELEKLGIMIEAAVNAYMCQICSNRH